MTGPRFRIGAAVVTLTVACSSAAGADGLRTKNVLALYWYGRDTVANAMFDRGLQKTLQTDESGPVNRFSEYLDTDRLPGQPQARALREYLLAKYSGVTIDVLVAESEPALKFLVDSRPALFPHVPIVYFSFKTPDVPLDTLSPGATGVVVAGAAARTLDLALKLHPGTTRAFVIAGLPEKRGQAIEASVRRELGPFERLVTLVYLTDRPTEELIDTVKTATDAVVLYIRHSDDAPGRTLHPADALSLIAAASRAPVYAVAAAYIGRGAVGGYVVDLEAAGAHIGEAALRLINGAAPGDIPLVSATLAPMFDWRQIESRNINQGLLPAGRIMLFRDSGLWTRYGWQTVSLSVVVFGLGIFGVQSWLERKRRRRAEDQARSHLAVMAHMDRRAALGELTASLTHELVQPLSAILRSAEAAKLLLSSGAATDGELETIVEDIRRSDQRATEIIRRTRSLLNRKALETSLVDLNTVARDVVDLVASDVVRMGVRVDLDTPGTPCVVVGDRVHLEQVLLNLMINGLDAMNGVPRDRRQLVVRTRPVDGRIAVSVQDTGVGIPEHALPHIFDPFFTTKGDGMGMGLSIVRTIVEAHAGRIVAENNSDQGATVRFSLPGHDAGKDGHDTQPA